MEIQVADWLFRVNTEATHSHTVNNSLDHCQCGYCQNYYEFIEMAFPRLISFLTQFGIEKEGPSELMPFEPTLILACYRVYGEVVVWGKEDIIIDNIPVSVEVSENGTLLLWIGEMSLPWVLDEPAEEVISPANMPEFLERMEEIWILRHSDDFVFS